MTLNNLLFGKLESLFDAAFAVMVLPLRSITRLLSMVKPLVNVKSFITLIVAFESAASIAAVREEYDA